jgi:hypothetical protein
MFLEVANEPVIECFGFLSHHVDVAEEGLAEFEQDV